MTSPARGASVHLEFHSAEDWRLVLEPVIARYRERGVDLYFRADAAFAKPEIYELLEAADTRYAIRLPANQVLQRRIGHLLTRPVGRPPKKPIMSYASFHYQAAGWTRARRVVSKVEWHQGELYPRVGFIVTDLTRPNKQVVKFYNGRGTAGQWIKEGKTRSARRGYPAMPSGTTRCGCSSMRSPTTSATYPHFDVAEGGRALVADDSAREAGQDRRQDRAPRPLRRVPERALPGAMILSVHDEIVLEVAEAEQASALLPAYMAAAFSELFPGAPLAGLVETRTVRCWADAK